jgi:[lysine-biosynthesis-protein LysW]--L-2-aminoadipate ligase
VRLGVIASRVRFEEKRIFEALERRRTPYVHLDPRRFATEPGAEPPCDLALNREISQSRGFYSSLLLEAQGVPTVNTAEVIETCGDKLRTSLRLTAAGVPTPRTAVALTPEAAMEAAETLGFPVVVKPLTGSWGRLVAVLRDREEAEAVFEHRAALPSPQQHIVYLQEFVKKPDRDIRVLVACGEPVAASYRMSAGWRTNSALGARSEPCPLGSGLAEVALSAVRAVAADPSSAVVGVDLVEAPDGPSVLEVNHTVEFQGLQSAHPGLDLATEIVARVEALG